MNVEPDHGGRQKNMRFGMKLKLEEVRHIDSVILVEALSVT